jgi:hypothetical protein
LTAPIARKDRRLLTLDSVPDDLLAECGLHRGGATEPSYRCSDPAAVLVPLAEVTGPFNRKLNREALASILQGFRICSDFEPVIAFRELSPPQVHLLQYPLIIGWGAFCNSFL